MMFGIKRSGLLDKINLIEDYPSKIAEALKNDEIDIGLIPVAMIPAIENAQIIANYCISAEEDVASVAIFSEVPLQKVKKLLLDYQSRTSVNLARILLKEYWKFDIELAPASLDFRDQIKGTTAGVVIGDRALQQRLISPYIYDLATAWNNHTRLPFVFAAWVANKPIDPDFIDAFNRALGYGLKHIDEVVAELSCEFYDLKTYYTQNIQYNLSPEKLSAIDLFHHKLKQLPQLDLS
jgi:chorismate dehydratase